MKTNLYYAHIDELYKEIEKDEYLLYEYQSYVRVNDFDGLKTFVDKNFGYSEQQFEYLKMKFEKDVIEYKKDDESETKSFKQEHNLD